MVIKVEGSTSYAKVKSLLGTFRRLVKISRIGESHRQAQKTTNTYVASHSSHEGKKCIHGFGTLRQLIFNFLSLHGENKFILQITASTRYK